MLDNNTLARPITVDLVHQALNQVVARHGATVETPEPACEWPQLCDQKFCRFPRYFRDGSETGLIAHVLLRLGLPVQLLRDLECEYELGEVMHPGVKIGRSRNPVLGRFDNRSMALLQYLQDHQKTGWSWRKIADRAFDVRWMIRRLDARRRPWLY